MSRGSRGGRGGGRGQGGRGSYTPHVTSERDIPEGLAYTFGESPFSGSGNPGMVPLLRFDGVQNGYAGGTRYRSVAIVYDGSDSRDNYDQLNAWDYLTELLQSAAGNIHGGQEYLWVHETTKRVILGFNLGQYLPEFHFPACQPGDETSVRVINELYDEANTIRQLLSSGAGLTGI